MGTKHHPLPNRLKTVPVESITNRVPPTVERAVELFKSIPDGEVTTTGEAANVLGVAAETLKGWADHPKLTPFRWGVGHGHKTHWGNAKTIAALKADSQVSIPRLKK